MSEIAATNVLLFVQTLYMSGNCPVSQQALLQGTSRHLGHLGTFTQMGNLRHDGHVEPPDT